MSAGLRSIAVTKHTGKADVAPSNSKQNQDDNDASSQVLTKAARSTSAERLVQANMILQTALNNMGRGLSMFGPDQRLIVCNKTYRELYQLPSSLCRPETPLADIIRYYVERDLGHAASDELVVRQEAWVSEHVKRLASQDTFTHEQQLKDGRIVLVTYQPLPGGGWVDLQEDVTAARSNEASLRLAAAVFTGTQEGIVITDPQGRVIAINPAYTVISGFTVEDLGGRNMRMVQSGRHGPDFYERMWRTLCRDGNWQGEVWNKRKNGEVYPALLTISPVRDDKGAVVNYVGTMTDMTRLKRSEVQLDHLAHHDVLTDLPNRLLLSSRLEHALDNAKRRNEAGAVLFLDLDGFKTVNDSFGHAVGDELLVLVARRLRGRLRAVDTVARIGGDEFVAVLENTRASAARLVAQELIEGLAKPFTLRGGEQVTIGATIGISLFPKDGSDAVNLIKMADDALYQAKSNGRGSYHFYSTVSV